MAKTFQVLATGDPKTDAENVIAMHLRIKTLEADKRRLENDIAQLVAQNQHLAITVERLMKRPPEV